MRRMIEREGWLAREAENGRVALELMQAQLPGLILLDLMMPEMDGFQFLDELRARPQWGDIPVIVVTSKDLTRHDIERLDAHVQRILEKGSYNRTDLIGEVRRLVSRHLSGDNDA
jgi:CheY-like chemotaxis protein